MSFSFDQFRHQRQGIPPSNNSNNQPGFYTVWMGDLEPWVDEQTVRAIWGQLGQTDSIAQVKIIKDKVTGSNAGYCFIDFFNPESAQEAVQLHGTLIPGTHKMFKLNWATHSHANNNNGNGIGNGNIGAGIPSGNLNLHPTSINDRNEFSVFVGDLSPEVTDAMLFQAFSKYPSTKSGKVMVDPNSNMSRGYGFVRFGNDHDQQNALIEMQGFIIGNRPIRVSTATPKNNLNNNITTNVNKQHSSSQSLPSSYIQSQLPLNNLNIQNQPTLTQYTDPNNTTVFVGGLTPLVTTADLHAHFASFGEIAYVKIPPGKGCGFVSYTTREAAELAILGMQGYNIAGSRVRLSWGRANASLSGNYRSTQPVPNNLYGQSSQQLLNNSISSLLDYNNNGSLNQIPSTIGQSNLLTSLHSHDKFPSALFNSDFIPRNQEPSEPLPVGRLNEMYIAAREGRLDRVDAEQQAGWLGVYAQ